MADKRGISQQARPVIFLVLLFALARLADGESIRSISRIYTAPTVKVAAVQCSSKFSDVAANTRKLTRLVKEAADNGARIVVLPEVAITGYVSQDGRTNWLVPGRPIEKEYVGRNPARVAQPVPGPATRHFCRLAKELRIYLTIPLIEVDVRDGPAKPRYFNTVCLASPDGKVVAHYRKLEPWPHAEKSWATPGDRGLQTFDTEYGRVGLAVCFDIHHVVRKYRRAHLWTLLFSTAWADEDYPAEFFYHTLPGQVRGEFKHHLIAANWSVDGPQKWRGFGFSEVISREGKVLAVAKSVFGSEVVYAELPVGKRAAVIEWVRGSSRRASF